MRKLRGWAIAQRLKQMSGDPGLVNDIPLLIDFATPSSIFREHNRVSTLPIIGNGPPGTFVIFTNGLRVSLPTDQIVFADDTSGHARVGFGGMQFVGSDEGQLVFVSILASCSRRLSSRPHVVTRCCSIQSAWPPSR